MPLPKSKKSAGGLGRAVIRSRFQGQKSIGIDEGKLHTTEVNEEPKWFKMRSVTHENDLEAFLTTAELAGTEFTAERRNVKVIQDSYEDTFLLSEEEEKKALQRHKEYASRLTVPRRPYWDKSMTAEQVQRNERESFLAWRRSMAKLEEDEGLLLTPFEKNIEVWRQLWRVVERSQLVVQIVDARNPLVFRSADLDKYVKEVDGNKKTLLLINKADYLTTKQRRAWADYFDANDIRYTFFSAAMATKEQEDEREKLAREELEKSLQQSNDSDNEEDDDVEEDTDEDETSQVTQQLSSADLSNTIEEEDRSTNEDISTEEDDMGEDEDEDIDHDKDQEINDERIRVLSTTELLDLLIEEIPKPQGTSEEEPKIVIGLVGYPNVGKSSSINALIGEKRVSVSSTPGKTKHFQTIHLTPTLVLCDCPGLVFPTFSTTKADQVCNGVLPIDQLREYIGPATLVASRIPQAVLEATYGIRIRTVPKEDGGSGIPSASELCSTYAVARGFFRSSQGNPDESRASRYILKDYVNGKLLYCHPPPDYAASDFNDDNYAKALKIQKKLAPSTRVPATAQNYIAPATGSKKQLGSKTEEVDQDFFNKKGSMPKIRGKYGKKARGGFTRVMLYPHQRMVADDGTPLRK